MKHFRWLLVVLVLALPVAAFAQQSAPSPPGNLYFEDGAITNGVYSNECLGFSLAIPAGWEVNSAVTPDGKARRRSEKSLLLLFLQQGNSRNRILLGMQNADDQQTAQDFVTKAVKAQLNSPGEKRELVQDTFAVDYGTRHFFRSDYKAAMGEGAALYLTYIYTNFRHSMIGMTAAAGSPEELNQVADSLKAIAFKEDLVNPNCSARILSSPPLPPQNAEVPQRVRVSSGVASGLIIKKVAPSYPPDARLARIQGQVVLKAVIDKDGNVESLELVSGHPLLAPAAIEAVKQWKYKPYLLNGTPVKVETQILVNFMLSGG
jgi:TonB family protein